MLQYDWFTVVVFNILKKKN
uniref:Uncharacterized protein n=1 Tax=Anguilla anguilla TaxID=7936 RepID=A0A0E9TM69_ANGAN